MRGSLTGFIVAMKERQHNFLEQRDPVIGIPASIFRGRAGLIKPVVRLQEVRRRIYL